MSRPKLSTLIGEYHRTNIPARALYDEGPNGFWSQEEISKVLDNPYYAGIKWRYMRTPAMDAYQKIIKSIPITTVIDTFNTLIRPIHTDFTEMTENEEFMRIAGFLYYQLYIQEVIYVSYNFFSSEGSYILPDDNKTVSPGNRQDTKEKIEAIKERGGFDVWLKLSENELDSNIEFMHIETSLVVKVPKWRQKLAQIKWGAMFCGNFKNWLNVTITYLLQTYHLENLTRLAGKRVLVTTNTNSETLVERIDANLHTYDNFMHMNFQDVASVRVIEYIDGESITALTDSIFHQLDRLMFEYGRVTNTNPKGERMTAAENYKDMSGIANRQKETLEYLISFSHKCKELWGIELEFGVSGIPEKEAIQEYSHWAQNPNSQAKDFTYQTEGTDPRMPPGQPTPKRKDRGRSIKALNK